MKPSKPLARVTAIVAAVGCAAAAAQSGDAGLAREPANPLAALAALPGQMSLDRRIGPADDGAKATTNVQPVIPFRGAGEWNLVTRKIVQIVHQDDVAPVAGSKSGFGDDDRPDISNTFVQPSVAYTWPSTWTVALQPEAGCSWKAETWSVTVNAAVSKLVRLGRLQANLVLPR